MSDNQDSQIITETSSSQGAPYEAVLTTAFNKLTSQIFIFLLAYMILVIGLTVFAPQLVTELRVLLYGLPALGLLAYLISRRRQIAETATDKGIDIGSLWAGGEAQIIGSSGMQGQSAGNIRLRSGVATGKARIVGEEGPQDTGQSAPDKAYLDSIFDTLSPEAQGTLIDRARELQQEARGNA